METIHRHVREITRSALRERKFQLLEKRLRHNGEIVAVAEFRTLRHALHDLLPLLHNAVEQFALVLELVAEHARTFDVVAAGADHRLARHVNDDRHARRQHDVDQRARQSVAQRAQRVDQVALVPHGRQLRIVQVAHVQAEIVGADHDGDELNGEDFKYRWLYTLCSIFGSRFHVRI